MQTKNWDNGAPTKLLRFPNKQLRAEIIAQYVQEAGYAGIVVFTCGNAAKALRDVIGNKLPIVEVGPTASLKTDEWWTPERIHATWPALFDATSGHLPLPLMVKIGYAFQNYFEEYPGLLYGADQYYVPSGSGETIICLRLAYPDKKFCAVYDNSQLATTRDNDAPLNAVIDGLFPVEYWHGRLAV